jgi:hypothetical protein
MKRKILLMGSAVLLSSLVFVACKKESLTNPAVQTSQNPGQQKTGTLTVDFGYTLYTVTNNDGSTDYRCLKPKVDCSKVKSAATSTRDAQEAALDVAIAHNETADFFATQSNWNELLPNLLEADQEGWLYLLKEGTVALAKKTDGADHGLLYIGYDPLVNPDSIKASDASFAIGVTDAEEE